MGIAAALFYTTTDQENCLDWRVRPSDDQYTSQTERWNDLADYLVGDLSTRSGRAIYTWLQGSYKFGTQVRPAKKGQEFDIDLGVYFQWPGQPADGDISARGLKAIVHESLTAYASDNSDEPMIVDEPKMRCSRISFEPDFHIDIPGYHLDQARDARSLATEEDQWEDSDPKAIYKWWKNILADDAHRAKARRIVRYLKMWAALHFDDETRPSSILLTVLVAQAWAAIDHANLSGDDELFRAACDIVFRRMRVNSNVPNPANYEENLNRLSPDNHIAFVNKIETLVMIADRALATNSKSVSAECWAEAFLHFFPIPDEESLQEEVQKSASALAHVSFEPQVHVRAVKGQKVYEGYNKIGPLPKGCSIDFLLANSNRLPAGATVHWTVRNSGKEAEDENDLGHSVGMGLKASENSAYKGRHFMDVSVKLNGALIGRKRVPVTVTSLGTWLRNPERPAWTKLRKRN